MALYVLTDFTHGVWNADGIANIVRTLACFVGRLQKLDLSPEAVLFKNFDFGGDPGCAENRVENKGNFTDLR